jgi:hypothetical protein
VTRKLGTETISIRPREDRKVKRCAALSQFGWGGKNRIMNLRLFPQDSSSAPQEPNRNPKPRQTSPRTGNPKKRSYLTVIWGETPQERINNLGLCNQESAETTSNPDRGTKTWNGNDFISPTRGPETQEMRDIWGGGQESNQEPAALPPRNPRTLHPKNLAATSNRDEPGPIVLRADREPQ